MLHSLSAPLQSGLRFFQPPLPAIPSALLADAPASKARRDVGFTMLDNDDTNELAPASHTGSLECPCVPCVRVEQPTARLLAGACQRLWLGRYDDAYGSSLGLGVSSSLSFRPH